MGKVNISLPDALLEEVDDRARATRTTRSGFLQEAAAHYLATLDEKSARETREKRRSAALDKMRSIAPAVGAPDGAKTIRELRDAAPRWDEE